MPENTQASAQNFIKNRDSDTAVLLGTPVAACGF